MRAQANARRAIEYVVLLSFSIMAIYVRYLGRNVISADFRGCLTTWYQELVAAGPGIDALLSYTGDYAMPYVFIVWLLSKLPVSFLYSLKVVNSCFDFGLAVIVGKIAACLNPENKYSFCWGYCITLMIPNVFLNSSYWGQCDAIYTFFLLAAFLCCLQKKYPLVMILFGAALSFKLQSIFMLPFLLIIYWFKKEFSALQFLLVPATMFFLNIPAMIAGHSPTVIFTSYARQTGGYPWLYYFYPNLYFFFQGRPYYLFSAGTIMLAITALLVFVVLMVNKGIIPDRDNMLPILLWTAYTCVFFLPSMHERYGYFAEITALIFGLVNIRKSWVAVGMILCTIPKYLYALDLGGNSHTIQAVTAIGNTCVYMAFTCAIWHQLFEGERRSIHA